MPTEIKVGIQHIPAYIASIAQLAIKAREKFCNLKGTLSDIK